MICVHVTDEHRPAAEEFFELFKTAWCPYSKGMQSDILLTNRTIHEKTDFALYIVYDGTGNTPAVPRMVKQSDGTGWPLYTPSQSFPGENTPLLTDAETGQPVVYMQEQSGKKIIYAGFDLFAEITLLLTSGQPPAYARIPTLDYHIDLLRHLILLAGFPVVEIPPCPPHHPFITCLTHDIDFVRIRNHVRTSTLPGFIYRATIGSFRRAFTGRLSWSDLFRNLFAVLSLPGIYLGWLRDFWMTFGTYRKLEAPWRSTFFVIPFRDRPGQQIPMKHARRRAACYDISEIETELRSMQRDGWEFGLHGIDAWHDIEAGRIEKERVTSATGQHAMGTRTHWLCRNEDSSRVLDQIGFEYDASCGYNETIGFLAGTSQIFKPLHAKKMLTVPLHIQDAALFYPAFLDRPFTQAWEECMQLARHQKIHGGVLTLLWHMRSAAPERQWGHFYKQLLTDCESSQAQIGTVQAAVDWFRHRRSISLRCTRLPDDKMSIRIHQSSPSISPDARVRIYQPGSEPHTFTDIVWMGEEEITASVHTDRTGGVSA